MRNKALIHSYVDNMHLLNGISGCMALIVLIIQLTGNNKIWEVLYFFEEILVGARIKREYRLAMMAIRSDIPANQQYLESEWKAYRQILNVTVHLQKLFAVSLMLAILLDYTYRYFDSHKNEYSNLTEIEDSKITFDTRVHLWSINFMLYLFNYTTAYEVRDLAKKLEKAQQADINSPLLFSSSGSIDRQLNSLARASSLMADQIAAKLANIRAAEHQFDLEDHPDEFICPITCLLMEHPVEAVDFKGRVNMYELQALSEHYRQNVQWQDVEGQNHLLDLKTRQPIVEIRPASQAYYERYMQYLDTGRLEYRLTSLDTSLRFGF